MARYNGKLLRKFDSDSTGNIYKNGQVAIYDDSSLETLSTIYSDEEMTVEKSNPFLADDEGNFTFFIESGTYSFSLGSSPFLVNVQDVEIFSKDDGGLNLIKDGPVGTTILFSESPSDKWLARDGSTYSVSEYDIANSVGFDVNENPETFLELATYETSETFTNTNTRLYSAANQNGNFAIFYGDYDTNEVSITKDGGETFEIQELTNDFSTGNYCCFIQDRYTQSGIIAVTSDAYLVRIFLDANNVINYTLLETLLISSVPRGNSLAWVEETKICIIADNTNYIEVYDFEEAESTRYTPTGSTTSVGFSNIAGNEDGYVICCQSSSTILAYDSSFSSVSSYSIPNVPTFISQSYGSGFYDFLIESSEVLYKASYRVAQGYSYYENVRSKLTTEFVNMISSAPVSGYAVISSDDYCIISPNFFTSEQTITPTRAGSYTCAERLGDYRKLLLMDIDGSGYVTISEGFGASATFTSSEIEVSSNEIYYTKGV